MCCSVCNVHPVIASNFLWHLHNFPALLSIEVLRFLPCFNGQTRDILIYIFLWKFINMLINCSKPFINESNLIRLTYKAEETSFLIHTICFYYTIKQIIISNTTEKGLYKAKYLIVIKPKKNTYFFLTSMSFDIDMILFCK